MRKTASLLLTVLFLLNFSVPTLMYHYIGNNPNPADRARDSLSVSPDKFELQMEYLKNNGYTPITLDTLYSKNYPAKSVVLTFDDGYGDFYTNAYPVLKKYNFHAVSFIPTGLMNQGYYLTWDQIREMKDLVSFESHGVTHSSYPSYNELVTSKKVLQGKTGQIVNFVAYPNGLNNLWTRLTTKWAGYISGVGTTERIRMDNSISLPRFANLVGG